MPFNVDVLVVDDRAIDADMTVLAVKLAAPGASVLWLSDGEQAIEYLFAISRFERCSRQMPGLILLDEEMPIMSGPCLLDVIRAHPRTYDIPVVMLSPNDRATVRKRHDVLAADAYIVKPLDFERCCAVLEAVLHRWLPADRYLATLADPWAVARPGSIRRPI